MNKKKAKKALGILAKRDGVTIEYVRSEIQKALEIDMTNPDSHIQAYWMTIPHKGEYPTPEEVICFIADEVFKKK